MMNLLDDVPHGVPLAVRRPDGVAGVASLIGRAARAACRATRRRPRAVDNLNARINAWWVMVAILAVAFLAGPTVTLVLFALASFFALREFITLTPSRAGDHLPLFAVVLPDPPGAVRADRHEQYGMFAIFIPVYAFLLLPSIAALRSDIEDFLSRTAKQQWGLMVTVYCLSHAPALLMLPTRLGQAGAARCCCSICCWSCR